MSANLSSNLTTEVSTQAIHERLNNKAVAFLQEKFTRLLNKVTFPDLKIVSAWDKHFDRIRIVDSTAFQGREIYKDEYKGSGGSSQPAGVKIQRFKCQLYGKFILLIISSTIMFKMRKELLENYKLEASEIKSAQIVKEYIEKIYLNLINRPSHVSKLLVNIFRCIKKNGRKIHRKGKKTFFDILGVSYYHGEKVCKFAA